MEWDWDSASAVPCCAAEAPTVSEDGRVYTFKLREGMKFHNGDPVDAESFIRGWKRVASPKMDTPSDICYHLAPVAPSSTPVTPTSSLASRPSMS